MISELSCLSMCVNNIPSMNKTKGPHTRNDNYIQSSESQVNLCMYEGHRPAKRGRLLFRSYLKHVVIEADDRCAYGGLYGQLVDAIPNRARGND